MNGVPALETRALSKNFGALQVSQNIDFRLMAGARHALIGPNGAGKTTLVNLMTGVLKPSSGQVFLAGADVTGLPQAARVKAGIARTFQINQLYRGLTVLENVCMAIAERIGIGGQLFRPVGSQRRMIEEGMAILDSLKLADDAARLIRELPYGRQRLVEIAIALGIKPKVLLLDEPAAGVPTAESHVLLDVIESLPADIAMLIIEHDMDVVFRFAREITVLVAGEVLTVGTPQQIAANERVQEVYLGRRHHG
ncbi:MAG: ABC transporter ATP-binding protein [Rhodospirillales bacterium]